MKESTLPKHLVNWSNAQIAVSSQQKVALAHKHLRLMHSMDTASRKSLLGHGPRLLFEQLKQRQEAASLVSLRQIDLHSKDITYYQHYLSTPVLLFFK